MIEILNKKHDPHNLFLSKPCQAFLLDGTLVGTYISTHKAAIELTGFKSTEGSIRSAIDGFKKNGSPRTVNTRHGKVYIKSIKEYKIKNSVGSNHITCPKRGKDGKYLAEYPEIHPNLRD